jgi:DNA-binding NtrC family response regulator
MEQDVQPPKSASDRQPANPLKDLTVLLVEEDMPEAVATRDTLQELGCNPVVWATNWAQTARMAATTPPEVLVVDMRLRDPEDPIAVVRRLRRRYHLPVVFLVETGDTNAAGRVVTELQAATLLAKPFDRTALALALVQAIKVAKAPAPNDVG